MFGWDFEWTSVATRLVLPLGFAVSCVLIGTLVRSRLPRSGLALSLIGVTVLWLGSLSPVADALQARLEGATPSQPLEEIPTMDAILVFGGVTEAALPPRRFADLGRAADRLVHAARLYHAGRAPLIVLTGGNPSDGRDRRSEAAIMADFLNGWGVPRQAMILEEESTNTRENCMRAKALIDDLGLGQVLLVTSALHMPRAAAACATAGLDFRPAATDYEGVERAFRGVVDLLPVPDALDRTSRAMYEWIGYGVYRWRGWIDPAKLPPPAGAAPR